ncbi:MAG: 2-hydroxyacyl-CoA dehydratase family protein [Thermodesulfobacteriota bacterium]
MMFQYFDTLVTGIENVLENDPSQKSHRKLYALEVARLGRRLYSGTDRLAWCGVVAPFDLLAAMGVTSCFVEFIGAMLAATGASSEFLKEAEDAGFAPDTCAYHRAVLGAGRKGMMPEPDFFIATSAPCTGGIGVMENMAAMFKKDLFVLNIPQNDDPASVAYLADQMRSLADFVSRHTGQPLSMNRLAEAVTYSNRAAAVMSEVYRLAEHVPSPVCAKDLRNFGIVAALLLGTPQAVTVAEAFRDAFAARIANNTPGVPGEKIRLLWIQNRVQFKNNLEDLLENEFHACIVADELNDVTWDPIDPADPFPGMAKRAISIPLNGPVERRVKHLADMARRYKIHGAINPCHFGCRQGTGARGLVALGLKQVNVPVLNLEVDCVDTRNYAPGQMHTRIAAFIEMLENRGNPWG